MLFLDLYHFSCGKIYKNLRRHEKPRWTSTQLRLWNEVATLFLVGIVFLVELKSFLSFGKAILGLVIFSLVLVLAIKVYKKMRERGEQQV